MATWLYGYIQFRSIPMAIFLGILFREEDAPSASPSVKTETPTKNPASWTVPGAWYPVVWKIGGRTGGIFEKVIGGWKKSCTTWDGRKPINNGINHLLPGAGFLPSAVC